MSTSTPFRDTRPHDTGDVVVSTNVPSGRPSGCPRWSACSHGGAGWLFVDEGCLPVGAVLDGEPMTCAVEARATTIERDDRRSPATRPAVRGRRGRVRHRPRSPLASRRRHRTRSTSGLPSAGHAIQLAVVMTLLRPFSSAILRRDPRGGRRRRERARRLLWRRPADRVAGRGEARLRREGRVPEPHEGARGRGRRPRPGLHAS